MLSDSRLKSVTNAGYDAPQVPHRRRMSDPHKGKVVNGHGILTSKLSVSLIGKYDMSKPRVARARQESAEGFKRAGNYINNTVKGIHNPSRLDLHMQVAYPETIRRLQGGDLKGKTTPRELKRFPLWQDANRASHAAAQRNSINETSTGAGEASSAAVSCVSSEYSRTRRTYAYNMAKAREANAQSILTGAPVEGGEGGSRKSYPLYPAKCSHQGLLSIDRKLVAPGPDFVPPAGVGEGGRGRWVDMHEGWRGEDPPRGWPSSEFGHFARGVRPLYS